MWNENVQSVFVRRHFEIMPQTGTPATATGIVTLYFTPIDFESFNNVNLVRLPFSGSDAFGKARLIIEKRDGVSNNNTGLPQSYSGSVTNINPDDNNIVWNPTAIRWEVSFAVTGFGGFFVKTQMGALPLRLISFTAKENDWTF